MQRALLVTVRLHEGRYHGLDDRHAVEWPPAPARLFQALLAGAARGATVPAAAQAAFDWLQTLPPPVIAAPRGTPGQAYVSYVPNNDLDAVLPGRRYADAVAKTRVGKRFRPTLFDATAPIVYCWSVREDDDGYAPALCAAADGLYQLGRGVDMAWAEALMLDSEDAERRIRGHGGIVYRPSGDGARSHALLCPRPGLRQSLAARFEGMRARLQVGGTARKPVRAFVQPPKPRLQRVAYGAEPQRFVFELREPDARAAYAGWPLSDAAELVQGARDKAAEHLRTAVPNLADAVERYLIGRDAGAADKSLRVRILPVPSVGHEHADMSIRRLAVRVPQTCPLVADDVAWAFSQVAWADHDGVVARELHRIDDDRMVARFERRGRHWRSVTPLALPAARRRIDPNRRGPEAKGGAERAAEEVCAVAAIHHALRHADVSVPVARVLVQREPFDRHGARAERFAPGTRFPKETLWHAAISFAEPVRGPLLLGDGRFVGLGLMLPAAERARGVIAFTIAGGIADGAEPPVVARAARRAMMARVQAGMRRGATIPAYVSGHRPDGSPAGDGVHRHVAVIADLPRDRLLYVAPSELQRRSVHWRDIAPYHRMTARALEGMDVLCAGPAGRLTLVPGVVDPESDALFAPARVWESVTVYDVARHRRGLSAEEALRSDVGAELERCGWPRPESIEVLTVRRGPRGGLAGRLRLTFRTAQGGPLLIGRTAHKGGGLFARC